jgi:Zn-dependent protease with chaperone function
MVHLPDALAPWRVVYLAVLVAVTGLALAPALVDRTRRVRRLTPAECDALGVAPDAPVRVLDADAPVAFAAGLADRLGRVVVSRGLLAALPTDEAAAVVRHERGHLRRGHVLLRIGVPSSYVLGWTTAVAVGVPGAFPGGLALVVPVAAVSFAVSRWTEFDADRYAAARGAGPALARALTRLYGPHVGTRARRSRRRAVGAGIATLLARHPSIEARVARLTPGDGADGTGAPDGSSPTRER